MATLFDEMDAYQFIRFIDEPIQVEFKTELILQKSPPCPHSFLWDEEEFTIIQLISSWQDFSRRGRMVRNMSTAHATTASRRGSWGVGRFYFRVLTQSKRIFDLYYDRSPKDTSDRMGSWFLLAELKESH